MKQEAVSMVIRHLDHYIESKSKSHDILLLTPLSLRISRVPQERGVPLGQQVLLVSQDGQAAWVLLGRWERKASQ